ncbi:uncharacterized protein CEXT_347331 [Caerostris extrusa]|uniref:Uncharacterized protein n=1 Tax=Caerostris extrusa TaxID=172846 RepID=A0AAV4U1A3_CAEEX|nr:uncharacterized protein CEXT_347331 [Caerostris extrusa]
MALKDSAMRNLTFLFVILTVSLFIKIKAECPPEQLISPCICTDMPFTLVECANMTDMQTLVTVFNKSADRRFESFALHDSTILYLPASAISAKKFEQILLVNVRMSGMFDRQPDPSNNVIMLMVMNATFLRGIGWENFRNLKKLQTFSCTNTEIKSLGKSFVDNNADVKSLQRSLFARRSMLDTMNFMDNQIESLPDDLFSEMPHIKYINLSGNKFTTITETVFGRIYNDLQELRMEENPIVCDCSIRWYLSRYRYTLKGSCGGPADRKGRQFRDLQPKDFSYCT